MAIMRAEDISASKFRTQSTPPNIWVEQITTAGQRMESAEPSAAGTMATPIPGRAEFSAQDEAFRKRYGLATPAAAPQPTPDASQAGVSGTNTALGTPQNGTNGLMSLQFRAISLTTASGQPAANQAIAFQVLTEIRNSPRGLLPLR